MMGIDSQDLRIFQHGIKCYYSLYDSYEFEEIDHHTTGYNTLIICQWLRYSRS